MKKAHRAVAGLVAGGAILAAVPSVAASAQSTYQYVTVSNENGVIRINTQMPGQPLFGASVDTNTGQVCTGFSYQIPFCVTVPVSIGASIRDPFGGKPPVVVDADPSDGSVGVGTQLGDQPLLSVRFYPGTGTVCAGFSYQIPFCVPPSS
jgi:hypothetical protein